MELIVTIMAVGLAIIVAIVGGYWAIGKLVLAQFDKRLDERFAAIERARDEGRKIWEDRFTRYEQEQRQLERQFLKLTADLPTNYVRREDHIRFETMITARLDAVYAEIRLVGDRQLHPRVEGIVR
jgi:hypothetical protein